MKRVIVLSTLAMTSLLSGCVGYPRLLAEPFDPGGRSLNSISEDSSPRVAGRFVVLTSDRRFSQDVYLYDLQERRLVDLPGLNSLDAIASSPDVSEDGRYIVFAASRQGRSDIYIYDRSIRQLRNLTSDLQMTVRNPTLSADGSTIAFEADANGQWDIFVYDRSGRPIVGPGAMP
ncbi:TolB family protein [Desertifilum tharense IPPAS B-1220]|uniref:Tol biopolymer transporter periplasmic protein n=2 Tax=Desertifilum TaxID=1185872 RepID=A0A1E5QND4_9CYAN|nr:Tol biopolymer transporter periplasmic protein [Desertifilum tharense IPPAS B-1220]